MAKILKKRSHAAVEKPINAMEKRVHTAVKMEGSDDDFASAQRGLELAFANADTVPAELEDHAIPPVVVAPDLEMDLPPHSQVSWDVYKMMLDPFSDDEQGPEVAADDGGYRAEDVVGDAGHELGDDAELGVANDAYALADGEYGVAAESSAALVPEGGSDWSGSLPEAASKPGHASLRAVTSPTTAVPSSAAMSPSMVGGPSTPIEPKEMKPSPSTVASGVSTPIEPKEMEPSPSTVASGVPMEISGITEPGVSDDEPEDGTAEASDGRVA